MDFTKAQIFDPDNIVYDPTLTDLMLKTRKCCEWNTSFIYLPFSKNTNNSKYSNESGEQQQPQQ